MYCRYPLLPLIKVGIWGNSSPTRNVEVRSVICQVFDLTVVFIQIYKNLATHDLPIYSLCVNVEEKDGRVPAICSRVFNAIATEGLNLWRCHLLLQISCKCKNICTAAVNECRVGKLLLLGDTFTIELPHKFLENVVALVATGVANIIVASGTMQEPVVIFFCFVNFDLPSTYSTCSISVVANRCTARTKVPFKFMILFTSWDAWLTLDFGNSFAIWF